MKSEAEISHRLKEAKILNDEFKDSEYWNVSYFAYIRALE
jgi:hypothetical protein